MKLRMALVGMLVVLIPVFGFAQGHGRGHGHSNPPPRAVRVYPGNPYIYRGRPVRVYDRRVVEYPGYYRGRPVRVYDRRVVGYPGYGRRVGPPPWAYAHGYRATQHVYFPDYRFFYDPHRHGYAYWYNNGWVFSPTMPGYMTGIDMGKVRIQVLNGIPLTTRPELYYHRYSRIYPSRIVNITVPIPR